jgi:hypothetical protein
MTEGCSQRRWEGRNEMARKKRTVSQEKRALVGKKERRIRFDYIKSNCFRVIRVDGVNGSPTPRGDAIQMAFFSERVPIPTSEEYFVADDGRLGKRTEITARSAIVREVEVEAIIALPVAKAFSEWLQDKIQRAEERASKGGTDGK